MTLLAAQQASDRAGWLSRPARRLGGLVAYETASTARSTRGTGQICSPFT